MQGMATALHQVATAFTSESGTPIRRRKAIKTIATDPNFTREERAKAIKLFRMEVGIADSYNDIDNVELRTDYLCSEMDSL
jgi:hypothetical protein